MNNISRLLVALVFSALPLALQAAERPSLHVEDGCPAASQVACMTMQVDLVWKGERSDDIKDHPLVSRWVPNDKDEWDGHAVLGLEGRLNGGPAKEFDLWAHYPLGAMDCEDFIFPVLRAGPEGGGTILTREGPFEILTRDIRLGSRKTIGFIDRKTLKVTWVIAEHWDTGHLDDNEIKFTADGRVFWKQERDCREVLKDGRIEVVPQEKCLGVMPVPAKPEDVERVRKVKGIHEQVDEETDYLPHFLYDLPGTPYLLYRYGIACT